jgi:hypothetical protein
VFSRQVHCNQPLENARISTQYQDGVLVLRIGPAGPAGPPVEIAWANTAAVPA